jgi:hypothetical protein
MFVMNKLFLILFLSINVFSQNNEVGSLIGKWNVIDVSIGIPIQGKQDEIQMAKMFLNATFDFKSNNSFELNIKSSNPFAKELKEMTKGTKWKFITKSNMIMIGNKEDNYSIIGVQYLKNEKGQFFKLLESGIMLKVEKS